MSLTIRNAILHILRNDGRPSVFSENELDIDSEVCEAFINKHVKKLMDNPAIREACFKPEAMLYELMGQYQTNCVSFKEAASAVAARLDEIMRRHPEIMPSDLLIARVDSKKGEFLAILKLNYTECYTHQIKEGNADNQLVKYDAVLPFNSGKVDDACLIALGADAMPLRVMEKTCVIDGEMVPYFSDMFLECETVLSKKETARIIDEITQEFVQEYFDGDPKASAQIKTALMEEAEAEDGYISMDNVAGRVFEENAEIKQQYVETLRDAGIRADVPLGARFTRQQFGTQRIKADNGIEMKFPSELASDEGTIEITQHSDGTVTVLFKRLRMV